MMEDKLRIIDQSIQKWLGSVASSNFISKKHRTLLVLLALSVIPLSLVFYLHVSIYRLEQTRIPQRGSYMDPSSEDTVMSLSDEFESYSTEKFHVVPESFYQPDAEYPLTTSFISAKDSGFELLFALKSSKYIHVTQQVYYDASIRDSKIKPEVPLPPQLYVVDWDALERDCHVLYKILDSVQPEREAFFLYLDLSSSSRVIACPKVDQYFDDPNKIRIAKRSIAEGRYWNGTWVEPGHIVHNIGESVSGGPILHSPWFLRQLFVAGAKRIDDFTDKLKDPESRNIDIAFFWRLGDTAHYTRLRQKVAHTIQQLEGKQIDGRKINIHIGTVDIDDDLDSEDQSKQSVLKYIETMANSKIVVVAQRDEWEDHYPLMEALASRALVFTDTILAPPHDLKNGSNCVIYGDERLLTKLLVQFLGEKRRKQRLKISMKGWEFAVGMHRPWHRIESLLFGRPLSGLLPKGESE